MPFDVWTFNECPSTQSVAGAESQQLLVMGLLRYTDTPTPRYLHRALLALLLSLFALPSAQAANWYVRPNGGTYGAENGTDWSNAFDGFSDISWTGVNPGDTIWVAGGDYTQDLVPGKSGTAANRIFIRRARPDAPECTSAAGWTAAFDSTVHQIRSGITFNSFNDLTVSGRTSSAGGTYGWWIDFRGATSGTGIEWPNGSTGSHITVEYIDLQGPGLVTYSSDGRGIDDTPFTSATQHLFSHLSIHDWESGVYVVGLSNPTFEFIDMYDIMAVNWSAFHPNGIYTSGAPGGVVRYSRLHRGPGGNGIGEGIFFEQAGGSTGWQIYGNVFYDLNQTGLKSIEITSNVGVIKIFNNTFDNTGVSGVYLNGGSCSAGSEVRNNLGYQSSFDSCGTLSQNLIASSPNIFVNRASRDYHIVSTVGAGFPRNAGTNLSAFFTSDTDGATFGADGTWDIGAYEFASISSPPNTFYIRDGATGTTCTDWGANACDTLPVSLIRGATYYIADGSYANYSVDDPVSGSALITLKRATDAEHGTSTGWSSTLGDGTATLAALSIDTSYVEVVGLAVSGGVDIGPAPGGIPSTRRFVTLRNVTAKFLGIVAEDILIQGGRFGGFDGCDANLPEDVVQVWETQGSDGRWYSSSRVTFDGVTVHDVTDHNNVCADVPPPAQGRHVDCMQILSGHFITIRNSRFYNCATSDIIARPFRDTLNDLTLENNFFGPVMNPGAAINMLPAEDTVGGTNLIRHNVIDGGLALGNFSLAPGATFLVTGNIVDLGSCGSASYNYNLFPTGSATCGSNIRTGNPTYVGPIPSPSYLSGIAPDFHLAATDVAAKDRGNPASYPLTDIDGQSRFSGAGPDLGADEYGVTGTSSRCDINADGSTNVSDVQFCTNQAIGIAGCSTGDINQDSQCNVIDVQRVVNAALGGTCVSP